MKIVDIIEERISLPPNIDSFLDVDGVDPNGYSKEIIEYLTELANKKGRGLMTSEEVDELLGL